MSNEYPFASMRDSFDLSAYFVVGPQDCKDRPLTEVIDQALHGGATFIQLRAKGADASELTEMARDIAQIIEDNEKSDSVAFVIDDRADVVWQARRKGIKVDGVHIGQSDMEPREARALLDQGVNIAFDTIGKCNYQPDVSRADWLSRLCAEGYDTQIVMSMDITRRSNFADRGGVGYSYLLDTFAPLASEAGVPDRAWENLLYRNALRIYKGQK